MHGLDPYIAFYLHCRCATFLGARTHCVALISAIYRDREETFMNSRSALIEDTARAL